MKNILLVILSVLFLTSCSTNSYDLDTIVKDAINDENYFMVSNDWEDTISLVSIDSSFIVKDYAYFNHTEKDTSKLIVKGHKDALVILTTVKQYQSGYYNKMTAMIVYDKVNKTSSFFAITSDMNKIKKTIKDMYKSDKVRLQEFKENVQYNKENS
jgi:hypothetical protein